MSKSINLLADYSACRAKSRDVCESLASQKHLAPFPRPSVMCISCNLEGTKWSRTGTSHLHTLGWAKQFGQEHSWENLFLFTAPGLWSTELSASHQGLDYTNPGLPQYLFILNVYGIIAGLLLLYCKRGKLNMRGEMEVAG